MRPGSESVLPVGYAAGVCNFRPEWWTRKLFGEAGVLGSLDMKPESAHKIFCRRDEADGKRRRNLEEGQPFQLLPQAINVRDGPPHGETSARGIPGWQSEALIH